MVSYKEFSDFDMFGYNVGLYFNGHIKESTLFGMIFTITYILLFIASIIYYVIETLTRQNYTLSTTTMKHENITSIKLDKEIFAVNFAMAEPENYAEYIDESIYYPKANLITGARDPVTQEFGWIYEEIKTGPCTLDMFAKENQHFFRANFQNNYCLYDIDKKNLTGHFVFDYYSKIIISFYKCVNTTENNNHCKPKEIIDYYLNNTYMSMILQSITIDETQIPITRAYVENPFTTVSQHSFKNYQINLKIVETEDDTGILFSSTTKRRILQSDFTTDMFSLNSRVNDVSSYCQVNIKLSDRKTIYKRRYEKITNALSKAGSLMTLIYSIIQICSFLPVKTDYEVNVINKVFKFDMNTILNKKMDESFISKHIINFNNEKNNKRNRSNSNKLNIDGIKNKNEQNIREINKDYNLNFIKLKKRSNSNLNKLNFKNNLLNESNIKRIEDNSGNMLMNNILNKRSYIINKTPNFFRKNSENNQYKWRQRKRKCIINENSIVDIIKFNWCQLLCYYPIKHCSNNIKINLAKNAQKFFRKTLDVISVFQNVTLSQKMFNLVAKNQRILGIYNKEDYYYNKPVINNSRMKNTDKNI